MTFCILDHNEDTDAEPHQLLCGRHAAKLARTILEIRDYWYDLHLVLEPGTTPKDSGPKVGRTKGASPPAPANLTALAIRDHRSQSVRIPPDPAKGRLGDQSKPVPSIPSVISSWVQLIAEELPITADLPKTVIGQLDLLHKQRDWIGRQPWVDDFHNEMRDLWRLLRSAVRDTEMVRLPGHCYLVIEDQVCGGALLRRNGEDGVHCTRCRSQWTRPDELARLAVALEESCGPRPA